MLPSPAVAGIPCCVRSLFRAASPASAIGRRLRPLPSWGLHWRACSTRKQASYIVLSPDRIGTEIYAALCAATARWPRSEVYEPHKAPVGPAPELNQLEQDQGALYSVLLREAIQQDPEVLTALQDHRATRNADGHPIWAPMEGDVGGRLAASILALAALRIYRENHAADQLWIGPHERLVAISQVERLYGWEQQDLAFLNLHWLAARLERVEAPEGGRAKAGAWPLSHWPPLARVRQVAYPTPPSPRPCLHCSEREQQVGP